MNSAKNLRVGLSVLGVFVASIIIWRLATLMSASVPEFLPRSSHVVFALCVCSATIILIALVTRLQHKNARWLGLHFDSRAIKATLIGMACFLIPASITLAVCLVGGFVSISLKVSPTDVIVNLVMAIVLVLIAEALPEELLFRGYFWGQLAEHTVMWLTLVVQAVIFVAFAGLVGAIGSPNDASFLGFFAVVLGLLRQFTQSLYGPIGFHLAFITTQQFLGTSWDVVTVSQPLLLQMVILTIIPFSAAIIYLHNKVPWSKKPHEL